MSIAINKVEVKAGVLQYKSDARKVQLPYQ